MDSKQGQNQGNAGEQGLPYPATYGVEEWKMGWQRSPWGLPPLCIRSPDT